MRVKAFFYFILIIESEHSLPFVLLSATKAETFLLVNERQSP